MQDNKEDGSGDAGRYVGKSRGGGHRCGILDTVKILVWQSIHGVYKYFNVRNAKMTGNGG